MVVSTFIEIIPLVQWYYREKILPKTNSNNICFTDISRTFFHDRLPVTNKHGRFSVTNEQERCGENLPSLELKLSVCRILRSFVAKSTLFSHQDRNISRWWNDSYGGLEYSSSVPWDVTKKPRNFASNCRNQMKTFNSSFPSRLRMARFFYTLIPSFPRISIHNTLLFHGSSSIAIRSFLLSIFR